MDLALAAGESGEDTDMSPCRDELDIVLPTDDRSGASRAIARPGWSATWSVANVRDAD
jgi:hypothetical protein